ncbi:MULTISPECIES: CAP domain-containing protein [Pseudomonas]|uniref:CAP domain-containing protein n=1 Tax=Pseudomonas TaxID=286 RepID=UPI000DBBC90D|nr:MULTISPECIES: CAP domain-containing protein [Pseudomonas]MCA5974435.1 hypothetical protein [Pseudomonas sp. P135]MCH5536544.1 CAP domain-containing protein [Pseudomonas syringae pv. syringae]MCH5570878.1 CAP domain-containing protein [Pseudomonas syringae pv. syringae]
MDGNLSSMLVRHLECTPKADLLIRSSPLTGKTEAVDAARNWATSNPQIDVVSLSAHHKSFALIHSQIRRTAERVKKRHTIFVIDDVHLLNASQLGRISLISKKAFHVSIIGLGLPIEPLTDISRSCILFDLINEYRSSCGLMTQQRLPSLDQLALRHTHYMARQLEMTHCGEHGLTPVDRVLQVLPEAKHVRECIARGLGAPCEILERWLGSLNHYNNIRVAETNACGLAQVWRWTVSFESGSPKVTAHVFVTYITCSIGE